MATSDYLGITLILFLARFVASAIQWYFFRFVVKSVTRWVLEAWWSWSERYDWDQGARS